jgi:hypothetical protein
VADLEPHEEEIARQALTRWLATRTRTRWLATRTRPLAENRFDLEEGFLAGFAAGAEWTEHGETHYGQVLDCPWCQRERLAGQHGEDAAAAERAREAGVVRTPCRRHTASGYEETCPACQLVSTALDR